MERKQIIIILAGVLVCIMMLFTGLYFSGQLHFISQDAAVPAAVELDENETAQTAAVTTITAVTTTTVTTTTVKTFSAAEKEKLHEIYAENITVVGDSIAYGFNAYGYISDEQNLAQGSVAIRNIHDFTFSYDGVEMDILEALQEAQPTYIYLSMGMNDVNMITAEEYGSAYQEAITSIQEICPDSNLLVAGITPIAVDCDFTDNAEIRKFNHVLEQIVADFDSPNIVYFDAYSVIADPETEDMRPECSGGDGIHLSGQSYEDLLNAVWNSNIYITSQEFNKDIYFPLKNTRKIYIDSKDFQSLKKIIIENYKSNNLIIDGRLIYLILVTELNFPDYILIYNIQSSEVESFNEYGSKELFKISKTCLYSNYKWKLITCYLILNYVSKNIVWKSASINKLLVKNDILDILLNYLGWSNYHVIESEEKTKKLISLIKNKYENFEVLFENQNQLMNSLITLKTNNINLQFI